MILFWSALLLVASIHGVHSTDPLFFRTLDHLSDWDGYQAACAIPRNDSRPPHSWLATVHNGVTGEKWTAALISPYHLVTVKQAVTKHSNGRDRFVDLSRLSVTIANSEGSLLVKHVLVPLSKDENAIEEELLDDLAIVQLNEEVILDEISFLCQPSCLLDDSVKGFAIFVDPDNSSKTVENSLTYTRNAGGRFFTAREHVGRAGAIWVERGEIYDRIIAVGVSETMAIRLSYWEAFICKHAGACITEGTGQTISRFSDKRPYMLDGELVLEPCSEDYRRELIKKSTKFTRLTKEEAEQVQRTCGNPEDELVQFSVFIEAVGLNHVYDRTGKLIKELGGFGRCAGVLISPRHVVTSAQCIKRLYFDKRTSIFDVFYSVKSRKYTDGERKISRNEGDNEWELPMYYSRTPVSKVVIASPEDEIIHDFALLEMDSPSETAKPICLPTFSQTAQHPIQLFFFGSDNSSYMYDVAQASGEDHSTMRYHYLDTTTNLALHPVCLDSRCFDYQKRDDTPVPDIGHPLFDYVGDRRVLYGITTGPLEDGWHRATEVAHYSSFICIHTGLCEEEESFPEERSFLSVNISDCYTAIHHDVFNYRKSRPPPLNWKEAKEELLLGRNPIRLNPLNEKENAAREEECGQRTSENDLPFPVLVVRQQIVDGRDTSWVHCTGVFISRRHVLTTRDCVLPIQSSHLEVSYGRRTSSAAAYDRMHVRHVVYPDRAALPKGRSVGLAVLELDEDVPPGPLNQIICLPDEDEQLEPTMQWLGGVSDDDPNDIYPEKEFNVSDGKQRLLMEVNGQESFEWIDKNEEAPAFPVDNYFGSLWIRRRKDDQRSCLYGMGSRLKEGMPFYSSTEKLARLICRMSGVCNSKMRTEDYPYEKRDIYATDARVCKVNI